MILLQYAALGYSLARVTSLSFTMDVPTPLINIYGQVGTISLSLILVLTFGMWENFRSINDLFIFFLMGLAGGTGTVTYIWCKKSRISKIMPFDYIEIFLH